MGIILRKPNRVALLLQTLLLFLLLFSAIRASEPLPIQPTREVILKPGTPNAIRLQCEVVDREATRNRGLMFRKSLGRNDCMLFIFEREQPLYFWMKNTSIPLSIAYIDSNGKIVSIKDLTPFSTDSVPSDYPARYALEMNRGWFRQNRVQPGDFMKLAK